MITLAVIGQDALIAAVVLVFLGAVQAARWLTGAVLSRLRRPS